MVNIGKLGKDEGKHTGPPPGDGANVAHTADTDGTPGDQLPPRPRKDSPIQNDPRTTQRIVEPDQATS